MEFNAPVISTSDPLEVVGDFEQNKVRGLGGTIYAVAGAAALVSIRVKLSRILLTKEQFPKCLTPEKSGRLHHQRSS